MLTQQKHQMEINFASITNHASSTIILPLENFVMEHKFIHLSEIDKYRKDAILDELTCVSYDELFQKKIKKKDFWSLPSNLNSLYGFVYRIKTLRMRLIFFSQFNLSVRQLCRGKGNAERISQMPCKIKMSDFRKTGAFWH